MDLSLYIGSNSNSIHIWISVKIQVANQPVAGWLGGQWYPLCTRVQIQVLLLFLNLSQFSDDARSVGEDVPVEYGGANGECMPVYMSACVCIVFSKIKIQVIQKKCSRPMYNLVSCTKIVEKINWMKIWTYICKHCGMFLFIKYSLHYLFLSKAI